MAVEWFKKAFRPSPLRGQELAGKNILIVDDGEVERRVYSNALESAGARVKTAADGASGLTAAREERFDLIILDYLIPDTNGIEVCRELKADSRTREIPILFLTGSMKAEGVINCYDAGADCYLAKPISAGALIQQVRMTLLQEKR